MFNLKSLATAAASVALLTPLASQAVPSVYTDKAAFMAAITLPETDTFEDLTLGPLDKLDRAVGSYTYRASAIGDLYVVGTGDDKWLSVNAAGDALLLDNFSANVKGVGGFFFATDFDGSQIVANVTVTGSDGMSTAYTLTPGSPSSFLGFFSAAGIQSININALQDSGDAFSTVNDLVIGAVPEPGTYALLLAGLALVAGTAKVRRRNA